jgi:tripartite-type tricarboxylate transporter receptor subunit TctC
MSQRVGFSLLVFAGAAMMAGNVSAASFPARPIRIVDGFPAGGGTDYLARVIAIKLTDSLGQSVIVDNRAGAASNLAAELVSRANPDGHTWFMGLTSVLAPSVTLYPKIPYNLLKDFSYGSLVATGTYALVTHPSVSAKSVQELVKLAKARPGELRYGSSGVAGPLHLAAELLKSRAGVNILHVPYKGAAPVVAAVVGGEVQVGFASVAAALPMVKANRLNALAVTSLTRAKAFPDLPTVAESGFPGFDVTPSYGILLPAGTPVDIVNQINAEIGKVLKLPDVQASYASQALEASHSTPARFRQIMEDEVNLWARVIREANIKAD